MPIRLYDSLSRSLQELRRPDPADPQDVFTFYNCGPTVYGPAHIGNFRTFVINDVLRRLLELEYGPAKVRHVRNITDVDDKTIRRARDEKRSLAEVTKQWTDKFHADCDALNCLRPHIEPTATGHIREQVDMIDVLMKKGHAYRAADGSVYFKVSSFDGYGRLSRVKERELQIGSAFAGKSQAVDADEKEDATDFALWKAHKPDDGDNAWDSPWGRGRPGWHIECSAMSKKHLGETIDLHTGGEDLEFPHHENEIAQSECCNGVQFSRHWYHSKHLLVDGKKMSKSLGNLYTLDDLRKILRTNFDDLGVRYALLNSHPRKQLNFTLEGLQGTYAPLSRLKYFDTQIRIRREPRPEEAYPQFEGNWGRFKPAWDALCDDMNVPEAFGHIFTTIRQPILSFDAEDAIVAATAFRRICWALGLDFWNHASTVVPSIEIPIGIKALASKRWAAKQAKDWAAADALRKEIAAAGWNMKDGKDGYTLEKLKS